MRVVKDMVDPKGNVLAKAGTVINPLAQAYAPLRMIVINPQSQQELSGPSPTAKRMCFRARPWCSPRITAASRGGMS